MDAEQGNQDGARDALDAGQQNTSHDARQEEPAVEGASGDVAPETVSDAPGDVLDEPGPAGTATTSEPGETTDTTTPAAGTPDTGISDAGAPDTESSDIAASDGQAVPVPGEQAQDAALPDEQAPDAAAPDGQDVQAPGEQAPDEPDVQVPGEQAPDAVAAQGEAPNSGAPIAETPAAGEASAPEAPAAGPASGTDTLDVAPGTAVAGDETSSSVAQESAAPQHPAPGTPGAEEAAEGVEPAGEAEDLGEPAARQDRSPEGDDEDEYLPALSGAATATSLMFHAPDLDELREAAEQRAARRREDRRRRQEEQARSEQAQDAPESPDEDEEADDAEQDSGGGVTSRRRRRRRRGEVDMELTGGDDDDPPNTVTRVRAPRAAEAATADEVVAIKGSTRLEAKKQRRRDSRQSGRRRQVITEAEFLARRESVERQMLVRQKENRIQIGVLEDGVLAEHFVSHTQQDSLIGNVYVGKVQNVLPSMEAAFIDIGRGRNAVLYAGEVNWDASRLEGGPRRIENALKSGDSVLVQVTKDPVGHKGARLTSQISLPGRYLVYVPGGSMTGISRKLPDVERARLKKILKDRLPDGAGVIVRTAAEGASEQELTNDINRLRAQWEQIQERAGSTKAQPPEMLYAEPDLTIKTVRDVFNEDFTTMVVQGEEAWDNIEAYVTYVAPDLLDRLQKWDEDEDLFVNYRVEEQIQKALDRKVFLPSGGSLVIDRTEAMTVVDVNTGKFTGSGGNLEETVTKNNLEAAEEIVRQLRLRDIGGIIVIDFIDMVMESNRELVLRRLVECLGRDRTKHQVAEVTSLGLVQMTRKRMGTGLLEVFSEPCEHCAGRGVIVHDAPLEGRSGGSAGESRDQRSNRTDRKRGRRGQDESGRNESQPAEQDPAEKAKAEAARTAFATIAAATHHEAPSEAAPEPAEESAPPAEARAEGSGRSRKKRRGKRSRNRGQNTEQAAQEQDGQEGGQDADRQEPAQGRTPGQADDAEAGSRLTIKGEVIDLPHGQAPVAEEPTEDPRLSLDSLAEAFDRTAPEGQARTSGTNAAAAGTSGTETAGTEAAGAEAAAAESETRPEEQAQSEEAARSAQPAGPAQVAAEPAAEPARPRRRPRRASAPAARPGEGEVVAGQAATAAGGRHEARTAASRAQDDSAGTAPTIVGVGVKAEDLTSGRPAGQG